MSQDNANNTVPPTSTASSRLTLVESKNQTFLSELLAQLQKTPLIQSSNARIEGGCIMVDDSIKKNNITYKQLQVGIEYFRVGWNRHRALYTR